MKQKGRFWFCPIYWEKETQTLSPRILPGFVLSFTLWLHHSMLFFAAWVEYEMDELYPIKIYKCKHEWSGIITGFRHDGVAIGRCSKCDMLIVNHCLMLAEHSSSTCESKEIVDGDVV